MITPVSPLVHQLVSQSVGLSAFVYLGDCSLVFSDFLHEVRVPEGYKSDRDRFLKKKQPFLGNF